MSSCAISSTISTPPPSGLDQSVGFDNGLRGRFNAWFFAAFDRYIAHVSLVQKQAAFGDLERGDIVELGVGVGANFDFIAPGSRLAAIEPNLAMHARLRDRAAARGVDIEILTASAEQIPLPDHSVDDVICSLVLCTVDDQAAVLGEVQRILRPGGRFRFVEHVLASPRSPRRWLQFALRRPWQWLYEGCDLCRETAASIEGARFDSVGLTRTRMRHSFFIPVNSAIHGIATMPAGAPLLNKNQPRK